MTTVNRRDVAALVSGVSLAGIAGIAAVGLAACASQDVPVRRTIPHTDLDPWGTNTFLHKEVELWKKQRTFKMIHDAGIGWIKQQFPWEDLEQPRKGQFYDAKFNQSTWDKYDEIVKLAQEAGIQIIARLDRPPAWARSDRTRPESPPENFDDFGDFAFTVAERYKGRVNHFQLWNEPNLGEEWTGRPDAAEYVRLLKTASTRLKQANPQAAVLSAPLAMNVEMGPLHLNEIDFLEQVYAAGGKAYFDILSANAYGMDRSPLEAPSRTVLNFRRVELLRQVMDKHGDAHKAIWFNEYGWNAAPKDMTREELIWQRVGEKQQADWTVEGVQYARRNWPWAGVFCTWYFRQVGDVPPTKAEYYFRLIDPDFTPRPVYHAVKQAALKRT
ncbi:MAG: cellulase family glycosylhydrolase [Chloroflexi bacterium]|nr:cellulase family glycosylhydrolase [Chloroflexota bacterium]